MIKKEDWFTIPNILSYTRILMIPLYLYLYLKANDPRDYYKAAGVLILSGVTDALDGIIARETGQITDLGKIIDPLADKLTQVAVIGAMTIKLPYVLPLLILFVLKELYLLINNLLLMRKNIVLDGAMWFGKLATFVFYLCMFVLIIFPTISKERGIFFVAVTTIFQVISLLGYGHWFVSKYKKENLRKNM